MRNLVVSDLLQWRHVLGQVPHVQELLYGLHDVDELKNALMDGLRGLIRPFIDIFSPIKILNFSNQSAIYATLYLSVVTFLLIILVAQVMIYVIQCCGCLKYLNI